MDPPLRVREDWWVFERPFFNGKEGRVDFRKNLRFKEVLVVFRRFKEVLVVFRMSRIYFYFFECQETTCRLSKNLLSIKRGFSKAFFKPYFLKKIPYF